MESPGAIEAERIFSKSKWQTRVGRVNSDATGTRAASREYWSNKSTAIMSDLPTETLTDPDLWGTFVFE